MTVAEQLQEPIDRNCATWTSYEIDVKEINGKTLRQFWKDKYKKLKDNQRLSKKDIADGKRLYGGGQGATQAKFKINNKQECIGMRPTRSCFVDSASKLCALRWCVPDNPLTGNLPIQLCPRKPFAS